MMKLDLHILDSKTNARTAIIALHGWTGDQFVLEPVANMLKLGSVKWFFPCAPYFAPTPKKKGFTWFEGSDNKGWSYQKTFDGLDSLFNQILNEGFGKMDIFVMGFSQGACLAMEYVLRLPFSIAGIIPIAGFIKFKDKLKLEHSQESKATKILLMHGEEDKIVDLDESKASFQILNDLGYSVDLQTYDAGHKIPLSSRAIIEPFIEKN